MSPLMCHPKSRSSPAEPIPSNERLNMSKKRIEYDADKRLIKVYRSFSKARTLVPNDEIQKWTGVLRDGEDEKGRKVDHVRYVFADRDTAEYNQQPLAFAKLQTFVATDGDEKPFGDDPNFSVREDFGIDGGDGS